MVIAVVTQLAPPVGELFSAAHHKVTPKLYTAGLLAKVTFALQVKENISTETFNI